MSTFDPTLRSVTSPAGANSKSFIATLAPRLAVRLVAAAAALLCSIPTYAAQLQADQLPSWNDGEAKQQISKFVQTVSDPSSSVPPDQRIAVFDLDGTLWTEQPLPAQFVFFHDRGTKLATLELGGGIPVEQYTQMVEQWLETAKQPCFQQSYSALAYKPMLELLQYMRNNGFRTYIVSGSGIEFIRTFSEKAFGIPPEQVIGSAADTDFETGPDGKPVLKMKWRPDSIDDGKAKAVSINKFIGRRPLAAFGNSDGDQQMLEWTAAGDGSRLMLLVHHTDDAREYKYKRDSLNGRLADSTLNEVRSRSGKDPKHWWIVVDMQKDWNTIYTPASVTKNGSSACNPR